MALRKLKSSLSLVVLGLLAERSMHPYAMRTLMRERGHERTARAGGASLYDAVGRLERAGLIEVQSSSREGRRPERTTYEITSAGRSELRAWIRSGLAEPDTPETFQAAISFMYALSRPEAIERLEHRLAALDAVIERAELAIAEAAETVPAIFLSEEDYAQHMRVAERDWVSAFVRRLGSGELRWPQGADAARP